jgi:hypothetical protein
MLNHDRERLAVLEDDDRGALLPLSTTMPTWSMRWIVVLGLLGVVRPERPLSRPDWGACRRPMRHHRKVSTMASRPMINIRPRQGNRSRGVEDPSAQAKSAALVAGLVRT